MRGEIAWSSHGADVFYFYNLQIFFIVSCFWSPWNLTSILLFDVSDQGCPWIHCSGCVRAHVEVLLPKRRKTSTNLPVWNLLPKNTFIDFDICACILYTGYLVFTVQNLVLKVPFCDWHRFDIGKLQYSSPAIWSTSKRIYSFCDFHIPALWCLLLYSLRPAEFIYLTTRREFTSDFTSIFFHIPNTSGHNLWLWYWRTTDIGYICST